MKKENKLESYKMLYAPGMGEITEKKSRFIATVRPVNSEEQAASFIDEMRRKYWDASHNCHAFTIGLNNEVTRCSDDGEPGGTAGKPMLDVLLGEAVHDAAVVVTRYFGGTLLGTGGLVRAYSKAAQEGLKNSIVLEKYLSSKIRVMTDYNGIGKIQYIAAQMDVHISDTVYTDSVVIELFVRRSDEGGLIKKITEATNGRAQIEKEGEFYIGFVGKKLIL